MQQPNELLPRFESLLSGFTDLVPKQVEADQSTQTFATLLDGFRASHNASLQVEAIKSNCSRGVFETILTGYLDARKVWAASQVECADDFNLFEVMGVDCDEVTHSKLLAWLLDHRIEHGTHAQGNLGFRLFLEEFRDKLGLKSQQKPLAYAEEPYWVDCEVSGDKSRVDIEIAARGKFIIHIENKICSAERPKQTHDEWDDLNRRRKDLGISEVNTHAVFLTLDGSDPENTNFSPVGWHRIAHVLEKFSEQAQPPEVKLFTRHYAKAIHALGNVTSG